MRRALIALGAILLAAPARAQAPDPHAAHTMPALVDPHAGHVMAPASPDPHAGHVMPPAPADPHAGHIMPSAAQAADPHAGHNMGGQAAVAGEPAPPAPTDYAADRMFPQAAMAAARAALYDEHGNMAWSKVMFDRAEYRPGGKGDGYGWDGRASWGDDIHRIVLKSEGDGASGRLEEAEVQALYSRAVGPYFNLEAGARQDFQPRPRRTYAVLGVEGLAPNWFDVEGRVFLSDKGDLTARLEGSYDLRLTQRLILEPRAEANLAAQDDASIGVGAGPSDLELGLRLRYALTPEFAPYVGGNWNHKIGDAADVARAAGEDVRSTRIVLGLRAWF